MRTYKFMFLVAGGLHACILLGAFAGCSDQASPAIPSNPQASDLPALLEATRSGNEETRREAIVAIGKLGPEAADAIPRLIEIIRREFDPEDWGSLGYGAAYALSNIGADAVPALIELLEGEEENSVFAALDALGGIGSAAEPAIPTLMDLAKGRRLLLGIGATHALGRIGPPAIPALRELMTKGSEASRGAAVSSLGLIGPEASEALPDLVMALESNSVSIKSAAARAIGAIGTADGSTLATLRATLDSEDDLVVESAVTALGVLGPHAAGAVGRIGKLLNHPSGSVRAESIRALGAIRTSSDQVVGRLIQISPDGIGDPSRSYNSGGQEASLAAGALVRIGQRMLTDAHRGQASDGSSSESLEDVEAQFDADRRERVRRSQLEDPLYSSNSTWQAIRPMRLSRRDDYQWRSEYKRPLEDPLRPDAIPPLVIGLAHESADVRSKSADLLKSAAKFLEALQPREVANYGGGYSTGYGSGIGNDGYSQSKEVLAYFELVENALQEWAASSEVTDKLLKALADEEPTVREAAALMLGHLTNGSDDVIEALAGVLDDADDDVVGAAAWALGEFGPAANAALPQLENLLQRDSATVSSKASEAIGKIRTGKE